MCVCAAAELTRVRVLLVVTGSSSAEYSGRSRHGDRQRSCFLMEIFRRDGCGEAAGRAAPNEWQGALALRRLGTTHYLDTQTNIGGFSFAVHWPCPYSEPPCLAPRRSILTATTSWSSTSSDEPHRSLRRARSRSCRCGTSATSYPASYSSSHEADGELLSPARTKHGCSVESA